MNMFSSLQLTETEKERKQLDATLIYDVFLFGTLEVPSVSIQSFLHVTHKESNL